MRVIVAIKQVPYVDQLKFDQDSKRIIREGVESEINPFDKRALTAAINLKQQFNVEVIAVTMGPPSAKDALIEALAMGADRAVHLLGREFAGADTLATARALALACQKIGYDLVLCGKYSTDAETAQVPPMLAEWLDLPQITGVTAMEIAPDQKTVTSTREMDDGFETIASPLPVLVTAAERLCKPIKVVPGDLAKGKAKPIEVLSASDLASDPTLFGIAGSPTWVEQIYSIQPTRQHVLHVLNDAGDADKIASEVVNDLLADGMLGNAKPRQAVMPRLYAGHYTQDAIWVVAEMVEGRIRPVTFELLGRSTQLAEKLGSEVVAVLIGHNIGEHVKTLAAFGADRVYVADAPELALYSTEPFAAILANAIRQRSPYAVLLPSTANGRDLAPRVAARLSLGLTGDCIGLEIDTQKRLVQLKPAFGGNIVAPILTKTRPAMATVRPGMLAAAEPDSSRTALVELLPTESLPVSRTRLVKREVNTDVGIELDRADVIIGVGTGVGGPEKLPVVQELAAVLNAPIGATRKVVDAGWLPRQVQIGLTGRSIAPRLYIAIGISGKFNHTVGIQRSGLVLAINNNPDAEIFKHADYGIIGDWAQIVPALTRALKNQTDKEAVR